MTFFLIQRSKCVCIYIEARIGQVDSNPSRRVPKFYLIHLTVSFLCPTSSHRLIMYQWLLVWPEKCLIQCFIANDSVWHLKQSFSSLTLINALRSIILDSTSSYPIFAYDYYRKVKQEDASPSSYQYKQLWNADIQNSGAFESLSNWGMDETGTKQSPLLLNWCISDFTFIS